MPTLVATLQAAAFVAAQLSVEYIDPKRFTDAGHDRMSPSDKDLAVLQRDLTQHLESLATRLLPAEATLRIEVLDIDLAGQIEPFTVRSGTELRIVRDVTWPRIKLRWTLVRPDGEATGGEETVSDMNFLGSVNRYSSGDRLRYEKAMLDDWFPRRFAGR